MKICANILCQKQLTGRQVKYCDLQCQRKVDYENFKDKYTLEKRLIQKRKNDKVKRNVISWKGVMKNSSIDAIRQLIYLPPLEIKEANTYKELIKLLIT